MEYICHYTSPIGKITLASDGNALIGLWFNGQKYFASTLRITPEEKLIPIFEDTIKWLDIYFNGKAPHFTPKLSIQASPFRKAVYQSLLTIPYGQTTTYNEIAKTINCKSAQAVGGAVAHNPISIIIPCHRVIGKNGDMTGYAGGVDKKVKLLEMEKIIHRIQVEF